MVYWGTHKARSKWRPLGIALIPYDEVENIKGGNDESLEAVLKIWLRNRSQSPTWAKLLAALRHETVGEEGVADDIVKTYLGKFGGNSMCM